MRPKYLLPAGLLTTSVFARIVMIETPAYLVPRAVSTYCVLLPTESLPALCSANLGTESFTFGSMATLPPTITSTSAMPAPTCVLHDEDPDQGINKAFCVCDSSVTLTPLSVPPTGHQSDSCAYASMPSTAAISISTEATVYTSNCQVCTQIQLNAPTCTSTVQGCTPTTSATPTPTFVLHLSNNTVHVGDAVLGNGGQDFRQEMMSKLKSLCPEGASQCDTQTTAEIDGISTVVEDSASNDGVDKTGKLVFTIQDSSYESTADRDRMLAAAVSAFQQSAARSCQEVDYAYSVDQHKTTGCGTAPNKREPVSGVLPDLICHAQMTICSGSDHISELFPCYFAYRYSWLMHGKT